MDIPGYSGTPLLKKLGITDQTRVFVISAPENYFQLLQSDITHQLAAGAQYADLVHLFVKSEIDFKTQMKKLTPFYRANPLLVIWISWYKKASGIVTDITENTIRDYALANDLVDIKVCAVSDLWSGLKLVVQKARR